MNVFPQSKDAWYNLMLWPFKAWVLVAYPFGHCFSGYSNSQYVYWANGTLWGVIQGGYIVSAVILGFAALVQFIARRPKAALWTFL